MPVRNCDLNSRHSVAVGLDMGTFAVKAALIEGDRVLTVSLPTAGRPIETARACLESLLDSKYDRKNLRLGITGANAHLLSTEMGMKGPVLELSALCDGLVFSGIEADAVIALGYENMYYMEIEEDGRVSFFNRNGQCAAGSGAFWYQQATRLGYNDKELAELALTDDAPVKISGRCAVFAKSDMTHAINEGATQAAVSAGLAKTLAEMVMNNVAQNRVLRRKKVIAVGGVANNKAVLKYLRDYCAPATGISVPDNHEFLFAIGAARNSSKVNLDAVDFEVILNRRYVADRPLARLDPGRVHYMPAPEPDGDVDTSLVYLGVDCGSVSTKCVLLDSSGCFIGGIYLPTAGRPALQVLELMKRVRLEYGDVLGDATIIACTTGSGRFLSQKILNAEYAVDEITCQAEGVKYLCGGKGTLSIIEIGGEDSKFLQLSDGMLHDYNMNPVCAAGTGTFLENLTGLMGIDIKDEFSRLAFEAPYAIDLGDTCTLLSQSALASSASQGLPLSSQLASLAYSAARNYITRTAENRPLEGTVIFTGATAKNHALASAFAAEIQKDIQVPPSPELTGALGSALMAKRFNESGQEPLYSFRSLKHLNEFRRSKRKCTAECEHEHNCTLDVIKFADGSTFLYGDRCGRFSGLQTKRFARHEKLTDYVALRNEVFYEVAGAPCEEGPTVGIACGGLFYDLYPFWAAFFREIGARVVLSADTSEKLLEEGKRYLEAEMCYPVEVLVGHYKDLCDKGVDYIFVPEPVNLESPSWVSRWPRGFSCPLLQTIRGTVVSSLGLASERVLYAQLNYRDGKNVVKSQLRSVAQALMGSTYSERHLNRAVQAAYETQRRFARCMERQGQLAIEGLGNLKNKDVIPAVFLGRSYTIYDVEVSKHSLDYGRQVGIATIPQEFILSYAEGWYEGRLDTDVFGSREEFDRDFSSFSRDLDNIYPAQIQRMLSAAFLVRRLNERAQQNGIPIIYSILQDPFKCGPNAMLRHYLGMVSRSLRLTMDEHTAPAGMITRLEAFKNTASSRRKYESPLILSAQTLFINDLDGRKVLIPDPTHHSRVFAAMFERFGVRAEMLPRSDDHDLTLARRFVNGDECLPMIQNLQDFLEYLEQTDEDPEDIAFFQGWACGPCRYGLYAPTQSLLLARAGYGARRICSMKLFDSLRKFGLGFAVGAYDGSLALDALYKMLHATRPYEREPGRSEALFERFSAELVGVLSRFRFGLGDLASGNHVKPVAEVVKRASEAFAAIPTTDEKRPRIVVAGEFYVRLDDRCNQDIIRKIEKAGGEVSLSPASELFGYTAHINCEEGRSLFRKNGDIRAFVRQLGYGALGVLARRDEKAIEMASDGMLAGDHEPTAKELRDLSRRYVSEHYGGEPPMTIGRACALARRGTAEGIIFVAPFTCLPGSVVEAQMGALRRDLGIPTVATYYDGKKNPTREEIIQGLVFQARQRLC